MASLKRAFLFSLLGCAMGAASMRTPCFVSRGLTLQHPTKTQAQCSFKRGNFGPAPRLANRGRREMAKSLNMQIDIANSLFEANRIAAEVVGSQLQNLTPVSALVIFGAGVVTSLSPCSLSVLPLTVGYIGGSGGGKDAAIVRSIAFTSGLALSLSVLGLVAAFAGQVYGILPEPWGSSLPLLTSALFIVLGLTQLEVLPLPPSLVSPTVSDSVGKDFGDVGRAALFGATSALISSPCGTPVLGALLALVAEKKDPVLGLALLFFYSLGSAAPLLVAGLSTAALKGMNKLQPSVSWVTPASGSLLMVYGTYSALERLASLAGV